jgi:murein DD-endopeptidase MepM/ murein hydrolase activator NlpD
MKKILMGIFVLFLGFSVDALEVKLHPSGQLYLNPANPETNVSDLVAHLVIVKNDSSEKVTLEKLQIEISDDKQLIQEVIVEPAQLLAATKELSEMQKGGMQVMVDFILPPSVLGKNIQLADSAELNPGEALIARNLYFTLQKEPADFNVVAIAKDSAGTSTQATTSAKIVQYKSPNQYIFPLQGNWYLQSVPGVTSHHRWMPQTEFGIDCLKLDEKGSPFRTDGKTGGDYYAFGQSVLTAADGTVVKVINDASQNWDSWFQREGETEEQFSERSEKYHLEAMKKDPYRAVTGNLVVIKHQGDEYSAYAHLKQGSVRVKPGDTVKQGQQIAEVGDTGDYYMAHLHFQISNSDDLFSSRSVPFEFINLRKPQPELGHFARLKN